MMAKRRGRSSQNGLYSVLLGAVQPIESSGDGESSGETKLLEENRPLYLAVARPDEDIAKVERAQIVFLVPNGIGTENIKDGAVTPAKLAEGVGMKLVYNDFADSSTSSVGQEMVLKRYTMPAKTLQKGMLVTVTGETFAYGAGLTLYVNGLAVKSSVHESQLDGLMRVGLGTINARLTGLAWDQAIVVEVRGIVTSNVGAMHTPQVVTCTSLTIMGD
jgi:hypothetical protein